VLQVRSHLLSSAGPSMQQCGARLTAPMRSH
jgi:hypothetical protein